MEESVKWEEHASGQNEPLEDKREPEPNSCHSADSPGALIGAWEHWRAGNEGAYEPLRRQLFPVVRQIVHSVLRRDDKQLAHDAFTAGLLRAHGAQTSLHLINQFKRIARNAARNELSRTGRLVPLSVDRATSLDERSLELESVLKKLRPEERQVVRRWQEGRLDGAEEKREWKRIKTKLRRLVSAQTRNGHA